MTYEWPFIILVVLCFVSIMGIGHFRRQRDEDRQEIARLQRLVVKLANEPPALPDTPEGG